LDAYKACDLEDTVASSLFAAIEERGETFDAEYVAAEITQIIPHLVLTGTGTTSFSSSSVVIHLHKNPEWLQHAYEEQARIINDARLLLICEYSGIANIRELGPELNAKVRLLWPLSSVLLS
jgi:cytochrome P450